MSATRVVSSQAPLLRSCSVSGRRRISCIEAAAIVIGAMDRIGLGRWAPSPYNVSGLLFQAVVSKDHTAWCFQALTCRNALACER